MPIKRATRAGFATAAAAGIPAAPGEPAPWWRSAHAGLADGAGTDSRSVQLERAPVRPCAQAVQQFGGVSAQAQFTECKFGYTPPALLPGKLPVSLQATVFQRISE